MHKFILTILLVLCNLGVSKAQMVTPIEPEEQNNTSLYVFFIIIIIISVIIIITWFYIKNIKKLKIENLKLKSIIENLASQSPNNIRPDEEPSKNRVSELESKNLLLLTKIKSLENDLINEKQKIKERDLTITTINNKIRNQERKISELNEQLLLSESITDRYDESEFRTLKKKWIQNIANSETNNVLKEVLEFAEKYNIEELLETIVHQSSRWATLERKSNSGTLSNDQIIIETNNIHSSIIRMLIKVEKENRS